MKNHQKFTNSLRGKYVKSFLPNNSIIILYDTIKQPNIIWSCETVFCIKQHNTTQQFKNVFRPKAGRVNILICNYGKSSAGDTWRKEKETSDVTRLQ